jgi:hypothetical protein
MKKRFFGLYVPRPVPPELAHNGGVKRTRGREGGLEEHFYGLTLAFFFLSLSLCFLVFLTPFRTVSLSMRIDLLIFLNWCFHGQVPLWPRGRPSRMRVGVGVSASVLDRAFSRLLIVICIQLGLCKLALINNSTIPVQARPPSAVSGGREVIII